MPSYLDIAKQALQRHRAQGGETGGTNNEINEFNELIAEESTRPKSEEPLSLLLLRRKPEVLPHVHQQADSEFEPWVLAEWRRVSIPNWRRILQESIAQADKKREAYARWMLREVLADAEYHPE